MNRDRAAALVREAGGDELCERLHHLDAARAPSPANVDVLRPPDADTTPDFDVVIAGGGLSLLLVPILAARGLRVAVIDRARVGAVHREWNGSTAEIEALSQSGVLTRAEVEALIVARYRHGVCVWDRGGSYPVTSALDCAFNAGALLQLARTRAEERGAVLFDGATVRGHAEGETAVTIGLTAGDGAPRELSARILVDARGASSPFASADLVCPTVGGVISGLHEGQGRELIDPTVGEILATTEGVEDGRQHLWEAFPGKAGLTTVYLFYYARREDVGPGSLLALYARFFERLPSYKRGNGRLVRPTFGYIPGWSRLTPAPAAPGRRVLLVGDAAARHSPLTFCGFGSNVRSLARTAVAIERAVSGDFARSPDGPLLHAATGALARIMAMPSPHPKRKDDLNALLDTAFSALHSMGDRAYGSLLRDEMTAADFVRFMARVSGKRPRVYWDVMTSFGPRTLGKWGVGLLRGLAASS